MYLLCTLIQATWGLLQNVAGLVVLLVLGRGRRRYRFRAALVTEWALAGGLSLGAFIFVPKGCPRSLIVHEYGHTVQSLILGPLYLPIIGLPSMLWANLPACRNWRRTRGISYYSFFPERWANALGERVCGEPAPR